MQLLISDASILIDIENGKLTSHMFELPYQFVVPDVLFAEELSERHSHLLQFGLINKTLSSELMSKAYHLSQEYRKTSIHDLLALTLAQNEASPLLTGDRALKKVAKIFNIEVRGTIWLVEQMIRFKKILPEEARVAFGLMKNTGSRLPWQEVDSMIENIEDNVAMRCKSFL